jgi:hypothetical protein
LLLFKIQAQTERNTENDYIRSICNLMKSELDCLPKQIKDTYKNEIEYIYLNIQCLPNSSAKESDARVIESYLHTILPEIIYHYTSYESFYNILKTRQLHLSAPWNANDPLEGQCHHKGKGNGKIQRYFTSFSNKFDSRLIWEAYGDKGRGVSIGFKTSKLQEILKDEKLKWSPPLIAMDEFDALQIMNYDPKSLDCCKAPFYAEENEIKLLISSYWWQDYTRTPTLETKFVNKNIVDYIPLNILQNGQLTEIIPEIILGPNFDNKNQISLNNFIQIQFNSSFEYQYLEPFLTNKPIWETPAEKLQIYVSRGNPKSISQYRESLKEKKSCASFQSSQSCSNARL